MNPTLPEPVGTSWGDAMGRETYVSVAVVDDIAARAAVVAAHVSRMQLNVSRGCSPRARRISPGSALTVLFDIETWLGAERVADGAAAFTRGIVICCSSEAEREAVRALPDSLLECGTVQLISLAELPLGRHGEEGFLHLRIDRLKEALVGAVGRIVEWVNKPLCLTSGNIVHLVSPQEIRYVESERRVLHVHAATRIDTYATLERLGELLPSSFVQCHKSYLVNLEYVSVFTGDRIILVSGESIPVSQRRRALTRERIAGYARSV